MNRLGEQLFPRSRRSGDQNRTYAFGDEREHIQDSPHFRIVRNDVPELILTVQLPLELLDVRQIGKDFNPSEQLTGRTLKRGRADGNWNESPIFRQYTNPLISNPATRCDAPSGRTHGLAEVRAEDRGTFFSKHLRFLIPRDRLSGLIERGDAPQGADREHPLVHHIQNEREIPNIQPVIHAENLSQY